MPPPPAALPAPTVPGYYPALTGVRAVAVLLVFVHHGNPFDPSQPTAFSDLPAGEVTDWLRRFVEQWHIGVSIFFVLSGFLIATRYQTRVRPTWSWFRGYLQNRFARIYPLYALLTLLFLGCWALEVPGCYMPGIPTAAAVPFREQLVILFLNLSFLRGFFRNYLFTGVAQGWSLTVEECFYLLAPALLLALRRNGRALLLFPLLLLAGGGLLVVGTAASPVYLYSFLPDLKFLLNWTIFGRATEFAFGVGLAYYYRPHAAAGSRFTGFGLVAIILCTGLLAAAEYPDYRTRAGLVTYAGLALNNLVLPAAITTFFYGLLHERTLVRQLLETRLLQLLGQTSYALYLIHFSLLGVFLLRYTHNLLLIIILTQIAAYLLWRFVEVPLQHRLRAPLP